MAACCVLLQGQGGGDDVATADGESSHTLHMQVTVFLNRTSLMENAIYC